MAYDLASAKGKLGILDATQDGEVTAALNAALAFAEHYCDRRFLYARETLRKFVDRDFEGIFVDRYPINRIHSLTGATGAVSRNPAHSSSGIVFTNSRHGLFHARWDEEVEIDYEGGYKALPADLEYCLWQIFSAVWPSYDPSMVGGGGGTTVVSGEIKKRTVVGVGSVEYTTSADGASGSGAGVSADWSAVLPGAVQAVLNMYKRVVA